MKYCSKCGAQQKGFDPFCPRCGAPVSFPMTELIYAAKEGNQSAFGNLYEQTYKDKYSDMALIHRAIHDLCSTQ